MRVCHRHVVIAVAWCKKEIRLGAGGQYAVAIGAPAPQWLW